MKTTVNQRLALFLESRKISQADYRLVVGVRKQQVSDWLTFKIDVPDKHIFKTIEMYPELNARWLLTGEGDMIEGGNSEGNTKAEPQKHESDSDDYIALLMRLLASRDELIAELRRQVEQDKQQ